MELVWALFFQQLRIWCCEIVNAMSALACFAALSVLCAAVVFEHGVARVRDEIAGVAW